MRTKQAKKRVAIDVGGTFTDCLVLDEKGELTKFKAATTPRDPSDGFMDVLGKAARHYRLDLRGFLATVDILIHGTTLATNTLITGRGAKTGMITTRNFRDILEMRRGMKPVDTSLYNVFIPPNRPLVPRSRRLAARRPAWRVAPLEIPPNRENYAYLKAKRHRLGHLLNLD